MDREQMIERVVAVMLTPYIKEDWMPWDSDYELANEILDAILPQVTTLEELEALPVGTRLLDRDGEFLIKISDRLTFQTEHGEYVSAEELAEDALGPDEPVWLPLTVVWRP